LAWWGAQAQVRAVDARDLNIKCIPAATASITVLRGLSCKVEPGWKVGVVRWSLGGKLVWWGAQAHR
jgi:hypothetical protein